MTTAEKTLKWWNDYLEQNKTYPLIAEIEMQLNLAVDNEKQVKNINVIPCCTELKVEKNYIDFEDWKKRHIIDRNHFDNTFLHDSEGWIEEHRLIDKYNNEVMNL